MDQSIITQRMGRAMARWVECFLSSTNPWAQSPLGDRSAEKLEVGGPKYKALLGCIFFTMMRKQHVHFEYLISSWNLFLGVQPAAPPSLNVAGKRQWIE